MRIFCCFPPLLVLALVSALSAPAVAGTAYEVNTVGATTVGSKNNQGVYIGQSFNSGTNTLLTAAALEINRNGLNIADFTLSLRLAAGSPGAYLATGTSLASLTTSNSVLSTGTQSSYTFNSLNWSLQPNTVYMLGIDSETAASVKWTLNQSATRDTSTGFITGYTGYNAQEGSNVDNGLHGATISAVPEPSTLALAGIAGVATLVLRRRRKTASGDR